MDFDCSSTGRFRTSCIIFLFPFLCSISYVNRSLMPLVFQRLHHLSIRSLMIYHNYVPFLLTTYRYILKFVPSSSGNHLNQTSIFSSYSVTFNSLQMGFRKHIVDLLVVSLRCFQNVCLMRRLVELFTYSQGLLICYILLREHK